MKFLPYSLLLFCIGKGYRNARVADTPDIYTCMMFTRGVGLPNYLQIDKLNPTFSSLPFCAIMKYPTTIFHILNIDVFPDYGILNICVLLIYK